MLWSKEKSMKLIYVTSKKFPSSKADPFYVRKMAEAFTELLGDNFLFLVRGSVPDQLHDTNAAALKIPKRFRFLLYFLYIPFLIILRGWNSKEIIFLSYDPYLLSILIFWRKVFRFKYFIYSDWHQLFDDWRDEYVALNSDYLASTSKRLKELLSSRCGVDPHKILVAYGGVGPSLFIEKSKIKAEDLRRELGLSKGDFLVGYIGGFKSIGMEKGLAVMIRALPYLDDNIKMVFVGGTKQYISEYMALAKEINVENKCIFIEKQPFEKVVEYELVMDVLVIPYPDQQHFRDYGFPMKVWEYMSSGRPIVYSNLEIMSEILKGRAYCFKPDDSRDLANVILSVYKNINEAVQASTQNPINVQAYTWNERAKNIINFIKK